MAANVIFEDSFACATEVATAQLTSGGAFATLTQSEGINVEDATISVNENNYERANYPRGSSGELPVVRGGRSWDVSVTVPAIFDTGGADPEYKPLLLASGFSESSDVYTANSPISQHSGATVAMTEGTLLKQASGCAFNAVLAGGAGEVIKWTFTGSGVYFPPQEEAFTGSFSPDALAPIVADKLLLTMGAGSDDVGSSQPALNNALNVASFSLDMQNQVVPLTRGNYLEVPVWKCGSGASGTTDETADANDADADDVPFTSNNDYVICSGRYPFHGIKFQVSTAASGGSPTYGWVYHDGSSLTGGLAISAGPVDFTDMGSTGIGYALWDGGLFQNDDFKQASFNSNTGYHAGFQGSTVGSSQAALLQQLWLLYPSIAQRFVVAQQAPRLALTVEQEANSTFDPFNEWRKRSTRDITLTMGGQNNNTIQVNMTAAAQQAEPQVVREGGLIRYTLTYGAATAFNVTFT